MLASTDRLGASENLQDPYVRRVVDECVDFAADYDVMRLKVGEIGDGRVERKR